MIVIAGSVQNYVNANYKLFYTLFNIQVQRTCRSNFCNAKFGPRSNYSIVGTYFARWVQI